MTRDWTGKPGTVMGPEYRHPREVFDQPKLPEPTRDGYGRAVPELGGLDRVEAWMAWKSRKELLARLGGQLERATKRGSRGTNVQLADLDRLLSGLRVGLAPS